MAGNKKPRKQRTGVKPNSPLGKAIAYAKATQQKAQLRAKLVARAEKRNNLPLGHPTNAWMLDGTFKPLLRNLEEQERTGTFLTDEDNNPMFYDGENWVNIVPAMQHMCFIFDQMARARVWGKQPPGLRVYAIGMQIGRKIDADDFRDARETLAWMREKMSTLTPKQWTDLFDWATSLDQNEAADA